MKPECSAMKKSLIFCYASLSISPLIIIFSHQLLKEK